jgi:hypothetical protein
MPQGKGGSERRRPELQPLRAAVHQAQAEPTAIERAIERMLRDPATPTAKRILLRRVLTEIETTRLALLEQERRSGA